MFAPTKMTKYASRSVPQAVRLARGLSTAAVFAPTKMDAARDIASKNKEVVQVVAAVIGSVGIVGTAVVYATGWKGEAKELREKVAGLETLLATKVAGLEKNLATKVEVVELGKSLAKVETAFVKKEDFAKVETAFVKKEDFAKVETKVENIASNVVQSARLEGENAALRVWKEKEGVGSGREGEPRLS